MGGISLMDIVDKISTALAADADLAAWASTHYHLPVTVMVGVDARNTPGAESCPLILIRPEGRGSGEASQSFRVLVDWAVYDDTQTTAGPVTEFVGVRRADEMGMLICAAVEAGMPRVLGVETSEYVLESVERYPLILGGVDINFNVPAMLSGHLTL